MSVVLTVQSTSGATGTITLPDLPVTKPTSRLRVGATLRNTDGSNPSTRARPTWSIVRTYNNGDALKVPAGAVPATSYSSVVSPGWAGSASTKNAVQQQLAALPDRPGVRVADTHEFDNPTKYGTDVTTYLADAAVFASLVRLVNMSRTNPLIIFRCCMAYALSTPSRNIDAFYTQDPGNYDEFGPDVYKIPDITLAVTKAKQYGKPLCIPEFGPLNNVDHTDPAILDEMQQGMAAWTAAGVNVTWACWFDKNGSGADLDQYPNALAYWTSQIH